MAAFCACPKNLSEVGLKTRLISLVEEISRQINIVSVSCFLMMAHTSLQ